MAITYAPRNYGDYPWQKMLFGTSGSTGQRPAYVYVPGGGWGLRDPIVITDPSNGAAEPIVAGALDNPSSGYYETYRIFVLQVASNNHNGFSPFGLTNWSSSSVSYSPDNGVAGDLVNHDQRKWRCIGTHTSSGSTEPGTAGGDTVWSEVEANDIGNPRLANRGEATAAYGAQGVADVQRAIGYIRKHALELGVDPNKIVLHGSSAGGNNVGCAAFMDQAAMGGSGHPTNTHPSKAVGFTTPNALILTITPVRLEDYLVTQNSKQGFVQSILGSLYGRDELGSWTNWRDYPLEQKQSLDPLGALERSGWSVPTYFDYKDTLFNYPSSQIVYNGDEADPGGRAQWSSGAEYERDAIVKNDDGTLKAWRCLVSHISGTDSDEPGVGANSSNYWVRYTGAFPDVHHALNGWRLFEKLVEPYDRGGYGQEGKCVMFQSNRTADQYRRYTKWRADGGVVDDHYTLQTITAANFKQTHGEDMVGWLNSIFS